MSASATKYVHPNTYYWRFLGDVNKIEAKPLGKLLGGCLRARRRKKNVNRIIASFEGNASVLSSRLGS